jgi:hypothetical protein
MKLIICIHISTSKGPQRFYAAFSDVTWPVLWTNRCRSKLSFRRAVLEEHGGWTESYGQEWPILSDAMTPRGMCTVTVLISSVHQRANAVKSCVFYGKFWDITGRSRLRDPMRRHFKVYLILSAAQYKSKVFPVTGRGGLWCFNRLLKRVLYVIPLFPWRKINSLSHT